MWGSKADIIDKAAKTSFDVSFTDIQDSYSKSEGAINRDGEERLNIPSLSSRDVFDSWRRANDISPEKLRNPTIGTKDNSCFPNQRNPTDSETVEGIESLDHIFTRRMFQMKRQYDKEIDCMDDRIERLAQFSTTVVKRLKNQIISLRETVDKLAEENYQLKTDRRRSSLHVEVENSSLNMSPSRYSDTKCLEARQKAVPLGAFERGLSPPHTRVYSAPILACTPSPIAVRVQPVFTFAEPSHRPGSAASSRDHKYIHSSNLECPPNRSPLPASPINADRYSLSRSLRDLRVRQKEGMYPDSSDRGGFGSRAFVGQVDRSITDKEIWSYFQQFGSIRDVHRPKDQKRKQKQYLYVTFDNPNALLSCINHCPNVIRGYVLNVNKAIPRPLSHQGGTCDFS